MTIYSMDHEDDFLASKFAEYREALRGIESCAPLMPYGWFKSPQTIRVDSELGLRRMFYRELADDFARDLANGINRLVVLTKRLEAWEKVIDGLDVEEKHALLHEFVQDPASTALLSPYTLKARFYFAVAHLSHQANFVSHGEEWSDDFATLPEDREIKQETADRLAKPWRSWKRLIGALNRVDAGDYKAATDDFRSKHTHRFTPQVELGLAQPVKRLPWKNSGKPHYGVGGSEPIALGVAVRELKKQCVHLAKCYRAFQGLVGEQGAALFSGCNDETESP